MQSDRHSWGVALAAVIGLALPPAAAAGPALLTMQLCGGGTIDWSPGGKRIPDLPGGCHAACAPRRDDEDRGPGDSRA